MKRGKKGLFSRLFDAFSTLGNSEPNFDTTTHRSIRAWNPGSNGPNTTVVYALNELRNKSRDLTRKYPYMNGAYKTIVGNILGGGISVLSRSTDLSFRKDIKDLWDEWQENCDVEGIHNLKALLGIAIRERYEAGEVFIRHRPCFADDDHPVPYVIEILEPEFVPHDYNAILPDGGFIIAGIEFDKNNRRVAYWMYKEHPGDNLVVRDNTSYVRIPAEEICHYFSPQRAGQIRGIPECFSGIVKARDLMIYDEAELTKKKMSALLAGFITTPADPAETLNADEDDADADPGEAVAKMEPGMLMTLEPGEDVRFTAPVESGSSYEPFMKSNHRQMARCIGMTYEEFTGDLSGVNFSSIRTGLNQSQREYRQEQDRLIRMVLRVIWKNFVKYAVLSGTVDVPAFVDNQRDYTRARFQAPGWAYVNPVQEVQAVKEKIKAGLMSRQQAAADMGEDIEEIDAQLVNDANRAAKNGMVFDIDPTQGKGAPTNDNQAEMPS